MGIGILKWTEPVTCNQVYVQQGQQGNSYCIVTVGSAQTKQFTFDLSIAQAMGWLQIALQCLTTGKLVQILYKDTNPILTWYDSIDNNKSHEQMFGIAINR